jgi:hypothetical protein
MGFLLTSRSIFVSVNLSIASLNTHAFATLWTLKGSLVECLFTFFMDGLYIFDTLLGLHHLSKIGSEIIHIL